MQTPKFTIGQPVLYNDAYYGSYSVHAVEERDGVFVYELSNTGNTVISYNVAESQLMSTTEGRLVDMYRRACDAHNGTSFSPEKRGWSVINEHQKELDADLATLDSYGATDEQKERYISGYRAKLSAYLGAKSNVISSMITGPARFPTARNEKRFNSMMNRSNEMVEWRHRVLGAWKKEEQRRKKQAVIEQAGGESALMIQQLEHAKQRQERMKEMNAAYKKYAKNPEAFDFTGFTDSERVKIASCNPADVWKRQPYLPFELTNNLANIKRMEQRVKELQAKEARQEQGGEGGKITGNGWELVQNNEMDRLQFIFDGKPTEEVRSLLKSHGYKWAPSQNAWQRQITNNAIYVTKQLLLPKLTTLLQSAA